MGPGPQAFSGKQQALAHICIIVDKIDQADSALRHSVLRTAHVV